MIIYKITNRITNLSYIGYTKYSLQERWGQHQGKALKNNKNIKFHNAIRKYGTECWDLEIIDTVNTPEEAKDKEILLIEQHNTYYKGYNSTKGGDGNNGIIMSKESNAARSKKLAGVKKSKETIEKFKNRKQTELSKQKISEKHKGKKKPWVKWTAEQCKKRGMTRRALAKEQYDLIHMYRSQNLKIREISSLTNISGDLVKKWLKLDW